MKLDKSVSRYITPIFHISIFYTELVTWAVTG